MWWWNSSCSKKEIDFAYQKDLKDPKFKNHSKFYCSWLKTG